MSVLPYSVSRLFPAILCTAVTSGLHVSSIINGMLKEWNKDNYHEAFLMLNVCREINSVRFTITFKISALFTKTKTIKPLLFVYIYLTLEVISMSNNSKILSKHVECYSCISWRCPEMSVISGHSSENYALYCSWHVRTHHISLCRIQGNFQEISLFSQCLIVL